MLFSVRNACHGQRKNFVVIPGASLYLVGCFGLMHQFHCAERNLEEAVWKHALVRSFLYSCF